ncbi:MAG: hypothetical protein ACP5GH_06680 [Nitrososphaeria archaeon]
MSEATRLVRRAAELESRLSSILSNRDVELIAEGSRVRGRVILVTFGEVYVITESGSVKVLQLPQIDEIRSGPAGSPGQD